MFDKNTTCLSAEFFVAAELSKQGHIVTITLRRCKSIDLIVMNNETGEVRRVQVKGQRRQLDWFLGSSPTGKATADVYVFTYLGEALQPPTYFIVSADQVWKERSSGPNFAKFAEYAEFKDKWDGIWARGTTAE